VIVVMVWVWVWVWVGGFEGGQEERGQRSGQVGVKVDTHKHT